MHEGEGTLGNVRRAHCQLQGCTRPPISSLHCTALHCPAADKEESFLRRSAEKLPGQALALSMAKVWEVVREHKDLNLPAHRVSSARSGGVGCGFGWMRGWSTGGGGVEGSLKPRSLPLG